MTAPPSERAIRVVLVAPEIPGNIGSTARAMKTMGLSQLCIVDPQCNPTDPKALALAHNAEEILAQARIVESLEDALAETAYVIGTTGRDRRQGGQPLSPREAVNQFFSFSPEQPVALVFGRESSGLSNPELALCTAVSTIPAATNLPALNLSHAVQVYVYELYQAWQTANESKVVSNPAAHQQLEQWFQHLQRTLTAIEVRPAVSMEKYLEKYRRVFYRAQLEERDVLLLHKLLDHIDLFAQQSKISLDES